MKRIQRPSLRTTALPFRHPCVARRLLLVAALAVTSGFAGDTRAQLSSIQEGNNQRLKSLLRASATPRDDANAKDGDGTPLLMNAVIYGDCKTVRILLDFGADPNATNRAGATALLWAAGDPKKALLLLARGANPNVKSVVGRTPLLAAASQDGAGPVVQALLAHGAELEPKDKLEGPRALWTGNGQSTPLIEAARASDGVALRALLAAGASVNGTDSHGGTALTEAITLGNVENVRLLLKAGAHVRIQVGAQEYTPLMIAAMRKNSEIVSLLLAAGADVNAKDASGASALMWAAYATENAEPRIVHLLLAAGADPSVRNRKGESAQTWAAWHGDTPALASLNRNK